MPCHSESEPLPNKFDVNAGVVSTSGLIASLQYRASSSGLPPCNTNSNARLDRQGVANDAASCNTEVTADRAIEAYELSREQAFEIPDIIRTATNLLPADIEIVRIVDIKGLDVQADGGTHVASTAQVGTMRIRKVENKGKGFRRIRIALED